MNDTSGLANVTEHKSYPQMVAFMDNHIRELDAYVDHLIEEIAARTKRLEAAKACIDRLTNARQALQAYLDHLNPPKTTETNG